MTVQTIYILGTAGVTPNFFGNTQLNGSAPTAANSAFGWKPAKTAITTPYFRGRLGATAVGGDSGIAASYNAASAGPTKGTGTGASTAGDCFIAGPFNGTFAATAWTFAFNLRAGTAGAVGHVNMRVWKSVNASGATPTQLLANTAGATVTLSTTADTNSSISWSPGVLTLAQEYLFFQIEWQETTLGTAVQNDVLFRIGTSSITTADFNPNLQFPAATPIAGVSPTIAATAINQAQNLKPAIAISVASPVLGQPLFNAVVALPSPGPAVAGSPVVGSPVPTTINNFVALNLEPIPRPSLGVGDFNQICVLSPNGFAVTSPAIDAAEFSAAALHDDIPAATPLTVGSPTFDSATLGQVHNLTAAPLAVQPPVCGAGTVVILAIPLVANNLSATTPALGSPALQPIVLLTASNLATAPPVEAAAAFKQAHTLGTGAFASSPPAFAVPAFNKIVAAVASPLAVGLPTIPAVGFGQQIFLTASPLAASALTIDAGVLGQSGVIAALPLEVVPPTLGVGTLTQKHVLAASTTTTSPPSIASAALLQQQRISATSVAPNPPSIGVGALAQQHALIASPLTVLVPTIAMAVLGQSGVMACIPIVVGSPAIGAPAFGQKHVAIAQSLATSALALGASALGKVLVATSSAAGAPVLGLPSLTKVLAAASASTAAPVLGAPACALRAFDLTASDLSIGPPTLPALTFGQAGVMAAVPPLVGAPVLGAPTLGQRHSLVAVGASSGVAWRGGLGPLQVPAPALQQQGILAALALAVGVPALGRPALGQRHTLSAPMASAGPPAIAAGNLGQAGVMAALPLWVASPVLAGPGLRQKHILSSAGLSCPPPSIGASALGVSINIPRPQSTFAGRFRPLPAVLGQAHQLNAQAATAGRPVVAPATMFERETFAEPPLVVGSPVLGTPALLPIYRFTALAPAPHPLLGQPGLGQIHCLPAHDLLGARPILYRPRLGAPAVPLDPIDLAVSHPVISISGLAQHLPELSVVNITSRQRLTPIVGQRASNTITAVQRAAPITGQRSRASITGTRKRTVL